MRCNCTSKLFEFEAVERRQVAASFEDRRIASDASPLLSGLVGRGRAPVRQIVAFFQCKRDRCPVARRFDASMRRRSRRRAGPSRSRRAIPARPLARRHRARLDFIHRGSRGGMSVTGRQNLVRYELISLDAGRAIAVPANRPSAGACLHVPAVGTGGRDDRSWPCIPSVCGSVIDDPRNARLYATAPRPGRDARARGFSRSDAIPADARA